MDKIFNNAQILWNYLVLNKKLEKSDCAIICGGHDTSVADCAIDLYNKNLFKYLVISGGIYQKSSCFDIASEDDILEAVGLYDYILKNSHIPSDKVYLEKNAKHTTQNLEFSLLILNENHFQINKIIIIHKPYVERRTEGIANLIWKDKKTYVTSFKISFERYYYESGIPKKKIINMMVGEIIRILNYSNKNWMVKEIIPNEVMQACKELVDLGYTDRLELPDFN